MVDQVKKPKSAKSQTPSGEKHAKKSYKKPAIAWEEKLESTAFMVQCLDGKQGGQGAQCDAFPSS